MYEAQLACPKGMGPRISPRRCRVLVDPDPADGTFILTFRRLDAVQDPRLGIAGIPARRTSQANR
ncbi:hypothetical protein GCM10017711_03940 [Paeniglutamicibacter sulfureus]